MAKPVGKGGKDFPDYGVSSMSQSQSFSLDMSELAVRLGSGNYFDRSGVQLYNERFDCGLQNWIETVAGAGSSIKLMASDVSVGAYAVKMTCGAVIANLATIAKNLPYPYFSRFGIEWQVKHIVPGVQFNMVAIFYTGTKAYQLQVYTDSVNEKFYYVTPGPAYKSIDLAPFYTGAASEFHVYKLVADLENAKWVRASIDTTDTNISANSLYTFASGEKPRLYLYFRTTNTTGVTETVVLDNIILTIDEPS